MFPLKACPATRRVKKGLGLQAFFHSLGVPKWLRVISGGKIRVFRSEWENVLWIFLNSADVDFTSVPIRVNAEQTGLGF